MIKYCFLVISFAYNNFSKNLGDLHNNIARFMIRISILFVIFFLFPPLGNLEQESKLVLAGALSIIATSIISFLVELLYAPYKLYSGISQENVKLQDEIDSIKTAELYIEELSELYTFGRKIYSEFDEFPQWIEKMEKWKNDVELKLKTNFSISTIHEFKKSGSNFEYTTKWDWDGIDQEEKFWAKAGYSNKLRALDDIIQRSGPMVFLGKIKNRD